jgi:hypothetical protein
LKGSLEMLRSYTPVSILIQIYLKNFLHILFANY